MADSVGKTISANADLYPERLAPGQIRLFYIEQPSGRCSFEIHSLEEAPPYACVSYTWGPFESSDYAWDDIVTNDGVPRYIAEYGSAASRDDDTHIEDAYTASNDGGFFLEADEKLFRVPRNVHDLIKRGIHGGFHERFWVDALCINQADATERSTQVAMMGDIYKAAATVHVWLGEDERGEAPVVKEMCRVVQAEYLRQVGPSSDPTAPVRRVPNLFAEPGLLEEIGLPPVLDERWIAFARFWNRCWFHRGWIVQEVTLTEDPLYWWGDDQVDSQMLMDVSCYLLASDLGLAGKCDPAPKLTINEFVEAKVHRDWYVLRRRVGETLAKIRALKTMINTPPEDRMMGEIFWRKCYTLAGPPSSNGREVRDATRLWTHLLEVFRSFEATDPRDYVYATLGIIKAIAINHGFSLPDITVDYTQTIVEVFTGAVRHVLLSTNCLNFLSLAQDPRMRKQRDLPSWVADLSARGSMPILTNLRTRWMVMPKLYELSQQPGEVLTRFFEFQTDWRILAVNALKLDEVVAIGESQHELGNLGMWEKTAQILLSSKQLPNESRVESLWRTLVANTSHDRENIAPTEMAQDFKAFVTLSMIMNLLVDPNHLDKLPTWKTLTELETDDGNECDAALPSFAELFEKTAEVKRRYEAIEAGGELPKSTPIMSRGTLYANSMEPCFYRRVFLTRSGHIGIGPISMSIGDEIWVIHDAPLPTILRRLLGDGTANTSKRYTLLGESYVHGDPEFKDRSPCWEWIELD